MILSQLPKLRLPIFFEKRKINYTLNKNMTSDIQKIGTLIFNNQGFFSAANVNAFGEKLREFANNNQEIIKAFLNVWKEWIVERELDYKKLCREMLSFDADPETKENVSNQEWVDEKFESMNYYKGLPYRLWPECLVIQIAYLALHSPTVEDQTAFEQVFNEYCQWVFDYKLLYKKDHDYPSDTPNDEPNPKCTCCNPLMDVDTVEQE